MTSELEGHLDERRTSALLQEATTDFAPDVDRLVQGGVARGRTLRRRRRVGTSLAAVAVIGILGVAAGAGSQLMGGDAAPSPQYADSPSATATDDPAPSPTTPADDPGSLPPGATTTLPVDASIAVSALDARSIVDEVVPGGDVGDTILDPSFFVDEPQEIAAPFLYDGTLTSVRVERAAGIATCAEQIDPDDRPTVSPGGQCVEQDGTTLLLWGPDHR